MPKILKTKGICLVSRRLRETTKSVTFYTENFGKVSFIAKGARNPKSKFGAALEIFTLSEIIFYRTESKPTYLLSDATVIEVFNNLKLPDKFFYASQITELILRAATNEDPNHRLFALLHSALKNLNNTSDKKSVNFPSLVGAYFLKAISLLGYKPELTNCVLCKNSKPAFFSIETGGVVCNSNTHHKPKNMVAVEYAKIFKHLLSTPLSKTKNFAISKFTSKLIQEYITYHLEKIELHSLQFNPDLSPKK
jgi:DNA repair protein RecO (recombination protein O)